jgi:hypothetical protein
MQAQVPIDDTLAVTRMCIVSRSSSTRAKARGSMLSITPMFIAGRNRMISIAEVDTGE